MVQVLERNDIHAWHTRFVRELEARAQQMRRTEEPESRERLRRSAVEAARVESRPVDALRA
jgi:hypothetical protein